MHFGINTFWDGPVNITYHDCKKTEKYIDPKTEPYFPCLNPKIFNPVDLDVK